jgi:phosphopantetheine--protein transferase-like protein
MLNGVGLDLVCLSDWRWRLERTPRTAALAFTAAERTLVDDEPVALAQLWAIKEAVTKTLGTGFDGIGWHGMEIREHTADRTRLRVRSDHAAHDRCPTEMGLRLCRHGDHLIAVVLDLARVRAHAVHTALVAPCGRTGRYARRSAAARRAAELAAVDVLAGTRPTMTWNRTADGAPRLTLTPDVPVGVSLSHTADRAAAVVARVGLSSARPVTHRRSFELELARA